MRTLSPSARTLLERLYHPWGQPPKVSAEEEARLLEQVGELREPASVPLLVGLLYGRSDRASGVAANTIQEIVDRCGTLELAQLDVMVRHVAEWRGPTVPAINLVAVARGLTGVLGVMSFHASGHVREAAVRILGTSLDRQALPFLLIRLNDWVSPVRATATEAVADRLVTSSAATLVWCLPLIYRLQEQSRGDHQQVVQSMLDLLRRPGCRSELQASLGSRDRKTRHLSFKLLAEGRSDDLIAVMEEASRAHDTTVRLWAARWLREHLPAASLEAVLDGLLADRFMPVRREALYGFVERLPGRAKGRLRAGLLDPHVPIRELARFHLRGAGETDHAELYRRRLDAPDGTLAVAIAGLGETGVATDAPAVAKYLADADLRVRWAAVRALSRLTPDGHDEELVATLSDDSPRVVKAAREVVLGRRHLLTADRLWPIFTSARRPHVRRLILPLVAELPWWDGAPLLVRAAGWDDPDVRGRAVAHLQGWRGNGRRLLRMPTHDQLERLDSAVRETGNRLPVPVREDVEWHLAHGRR